MAVVPHWLVVLWFVGVLRTVFLCQFIARSSSMCFLLFESLGTLCCPPSLPLERSQSLNSSGRAFTSSSGCSVMFLNRLAS